MVYLKYYLIIYKEWFSKTINSHLPFLKLNHVTLTCSQRYFHWAIQSQCLGFVVCGCNCEMKKKKKNYFFFGSFHILQLESKWVSNTLAYLWSYANRTLRLMRRVVSLLWQLNCILIHLPVLWAKFFWDGLGVYKSNSSRNLYVALKPVPSSRSLERKVTLKNLRSDSISNSLSWPHFREYLRSCAMKLENST